MNRLFILIISYRQLLWPASWYQGPYFDHLPEVVELERSLTIPRWSQIESRDCLLARSPKDFPRYQFRERASRCDNPSVRRSPRSLVLVSPARLFDGRDFFYLTTSRADTEKEELRVQVSTLRYELENIKQERDVTALRHEKELRDLQLKADADFRKAQVCHGPALPIEKMLTICVLIGRRIS